MKSDAVWYSVFSTIVQGSGSAEHIMQNRTFVTHSTKQTQKKTSLHCSIVLSGANVLTRKGIANAPKQFTNWTMDITNAVYCRAINAADFRDPQVTKEWFLWVYVKLKQTYAQKTDTWSET